MNPVEMSEAIKGIQASGGLEHYILYCLVAFAFAVVAFLGRDYIKNHERLILALEKNTQALDKIGGQVAAVELLVDEIDRGGCRYASRPATIP